LSINDLGVSMPCNNVLFSASLESMGLALMKRKKSVSNISLGENKKGFDFSRINIKLRDKMLRITGERDRRDEN